MSRKSDEYLRGVPTKPYDLVREGLIALGIIAAMVIVLAIVFESPDAPTVRGEDVARNHPLNYLKTATDFLSGESGLQTYGPPYTKDRENIQRILGPGPAVVLGVTLPLDARQNLIITPLEKVAILDKNVAVALAGWKAASEDQQAAWTKAFSDALDKAEESEGKVTVPSGDYGPVPVMMKGMLDLGRAGLLEGALTSSDRLPYTLDNTKAMLFFQEDVDQNVADSYDMKGTQWGITHEVGNFPGPWWLWPYAIWYQIPPLTTAPNADVIVGSLMVLFFLLLLFAPFIPVLKHLPRWIPLYRLIWRDWYESQEGRGRRKAGQ
ncbi:MAG: hypothetical protein ABSG63_02090 [Spirochaetia bacterium]|jgi:hypothetical protein